VTSSGAVKSLDAIHRAYPAPTAQLSVLKSTATYPGRLDNEAD
jgi:hypothetical protein